MFLNYFCHTNAQMFPADVLRNNSAVSYVNTGFYDDCKHTGSFLNMLALMLTSASSSSLLALPFARLTLVLTTSLVAGLDAELKSLNGDHFATLEAARLTWYRRPSSPPAWPYLMDCFGQKFLGG